MTAPADGGGAAPAGRRAAIVLSVGDELLLGDVADTNAAEVARALREAGFVVRAIRCVGDEVVAIAESLTAAARDAEVVIVTGGLGPTRDDLTRDALARALGEPLVEDAASLAAIAALLERVGGRLSDSNRLQALRPASAAHLPNPIGTAPGIAARLAGARVFVLPGVPVEMRRMLAEQVLPRLGAPAAAATVDRVPRVRLHGTGLAESAVGDAIADLMDRGAAVLVGVTVAGGIFTVSATGVAAGRDEVEHVAAEIERRLGNALFGRDGTTLEAAVIARLVAKGLRVATAESCTGGLVAEALTRVPGSSKAFVEGFVCYANEAKVRTLGVAAELLERHGAVSEEVAAALARGAAERTGAERAVSVTGIAGPDGGTAEKPVGLVWFGLAADGRMRTHRRVFSGDRDAIRRRAARFALDLVRRSLQ